MPVGIDFECFSEVDIMNEGGFKYADHDSTEILILSYAIDDQPVKLWTPADFSLPDEVIERVRDDDEVYAFGAFDFRIWNWIGNREFDFPTMTLNQYNDIQALAQSYSLHGNLAQAGDDLRVPIRKDRRGKELLKFFCCLDKKGKRNWPWDHTGLFEEFKTYCFFDTASMREIRNALPRQQLIPIEKRIYNLTYRMNTRGLPVDVESAKIIGDKIEKFREELRPRLSKITHGKITKETQTARIKDFCSPIPNVQADTVSDWLKKPDLPKEVRQVLEIKEMLGGTAVAKFKKLLTLVYQDTVHDNLRFHGAGPGRWTGQGFQMQNLPRFSVKNYYKMHGIKFINIVQDVECALSWFKDDFYIDNPIHLAKGLVRSMIRARNKYSLIVSDYSAIECVLLLWLAEDWAGVKKIADGEDLYIDMASEIYQKSARHITGDERQFGKVIILGCGYCMGWKTFQSTAATWGIIITDEQAKYAVKTYRRHYSIVVDFWYELQSACLKAVASGQKQTVGKITFGTFTINGHRWLAMQLPSGKSIYYNSPRITHKAIPGYEHMGKRATVVHMGINPYTKKWSELTLSPNRLVENATQGTAREVMAQGLLNIVDNMKYVNLLGTVHDEAIGEILTELITPDVQPKFDSLLCDISWAKDCPITAKGYIAERYRKE